GQGRVGEKALERRYAGATRRGDGTMLVLWLPSAQPQEIVNERIARPRIECDELIPADETQIRNPAEIEHSDRMGAPEQSHHGPVKYRHHGRSLSSSGDIRGAKPVDDGNADARRKRFAIAELNA